MAKFKVNKPNPPATGWGYKGKIVLPGSEVEVADAEVEKYTKRGMIGEPKPAEAPAVPTRQTQEVSGVPTAAPDGTVPVRKTQEVVTPPPMPARNLRARGVRDDEK